MTSALPYLSALAAPILLPQSTTLYPLVSKKSTTLATSLLSLAPSVTLSSSLFLPHPMKSKQPNEKFLGRYFSRDTAYSLEEELPCRYRIIQLFELHGRRIVSWIYLLQQSTFYYRRRYSQSRYVNEEVPSWVSRQFARGGRTMPLMSTSQQPFFQLSYCLAIYLFGYLSRTLSLIVIFIF